MTIAPTRMSLTDVMLVEPAHTCGVPIKQKCGALHEVERRARDVQNNRRVESHKNNSRRNIAKKESQRVTNRNMLANAKRSKTVLS